MPWVKDDNGVLKVDDSGNPIFAYPDGNQAGINFDSQYTKIAELNSKLLNRKKMITEQESILNLLSNSAGVDVKNVDAVTEFLSKAIENEKKIQNFNDSDFIKADEVDKLKERISADLNGQMEKQKLAYENKLSEATAALAAKDKTIHSSIIKNAILSSEFIRKNTTFAHPDIAYNYLQKHFRVENGANGEESYGVGLDSDGDPLRSIADPSKVASMDEAIELVIKNHPQSKALLSPDGSGTGKPPGGGGQPPPGSKTPKTVPITDSKSFIDNLEGIAKGEVVRE